MIHIDKGAAYTGFCHYWIICCEIYQILYSSIQSVVIPILKLRRRNLMYNSSIIIATHMSYNYFPCVKGRSINNIRKYLYPSSVKLWLRPAVLVVTYALSSFKPVIGCGLTTPQFLKLLFSLSMHLLPRMNVMLDCICIGQVELQ